MKRGLAGAFTTWLALVALQTLATSKSAPSRIRELFQDANAVIERVLDPTVPAIPDRREGAAPTTDTTKTKTKTRRAS